MAFASYQTQLFRARRHRIQECRGVARTFHFAAYVSFGSEPPKFHQFALQVVTRHPERIVMYVEDQQLVVSYGHGTPIVHKLKDLLVQSDAEAAS